MSRKGLTDSQREFLLALRSGLKPKVHTIPSWGNTQHSLVKLGLVRIASGGVPTLTDEGVAILRCGVAHVPKPKKLKEKAMKEDDLLEEIEQLTNERDEARAEIEQLLEEVGRLRSSTAVQRGPCGMRGHAADCDCEGAGGDR